MIHHNLLHRFVERPVKLQSDLNSKMDPDSGQSHVDEKIRDSRDNGEESVVDLSDSDTEIDQMDRAPLDVAVDYPAEDVPLAEGLVNNDLDDIVPLAEGLMNPQDEPQILDPAGDNPQDDPIPQREVLPTQVTRAGRETKIPARFKEYDCST